MPHRLLLSHRNRPPGALSRRHFQQLDIKSGLDRLSALYGRLLLYQFCKHSSYGSLSCGFLLPRRLEFSFHLHMSDRVQMPSSVYRTNSLLGLYGVSGPNGQQHLQDLPAWLPMHGFGNDQMPASVHRHILLLRWHNKNGQVMRAGLLQQCGWLLVYQ